MTILKLARINYNYHADNWCQLRITTAIERSSKIKRCRCMCLSAFSPKIFTITVGTQSVSDGDGQE
jgi:hypothetical protein